VMISRVACFASGDIVRLPRGTVATQYNPEGAMAG